MASEKHIQMHDDMVFSINRESREASRRMQRHIAAFRAMLALKSGASHVCVFSSDDEAKEFMGLVRRMLGDPDGD